MAAMAVGHCDHDAIVDGHMGGGYGEIRLRDDFSVVLSGTVWYPACPTCGESRLQHVCCAKCKQKRPQLKECFGLMLCDTCYPCNGEHEPKFELTLGNPKD